jgi:hypothetical protein
MRFNRSGLVPGAGSPERYLGLAISSQARLSTTGRWSLGVGAYLTVLALECEPVDPRLCPSRLIDYRSDEHHSGIFEDFFGNPITSPTAVMREGRWAFGEDGGTAKGWLAEQRSRMESPQNRWNERGGMLGLSKGRP